MEVPVISDLSDLPLGLRTEARDAILRFSQGEIGIGELALRLFCFATQLNRRPSDRYTYADLKKLRLDEEEEQELLTGAMRVVEPLVKKLSERAEKSEGEAEEAKNARRGRRTETA